MNKNESAGVELKGVDNDIAMIDNNRYHNS